MSLIRFLGCISKFILYKKWLFLFLSAIVIFLLILDLWSWQFIQDFRLTQWSPRIEHYVAFGTFMVAFAAWFSTVKQEWRERLPQSLSVYFEYQGRIVLRCNLANLTGEADIRQLGQQIGSQMTGGQFLAFAAPLVEWREQAIYYSARYKSNQHCPENLPDYPFRHYVVLYRLSKLPAGMDENTSYIWSPPFKLIPPRLSFQKGEEHQNQQKRETICNFSPPPKKQYRFQYTEKITLDEPSSSSQSTIFNEQLFWKSVSTQGPHLLRSKCKHQEAPTKNESD